MQNKEIFEYWHKKLKDFELLQSIKSGKEAEVYKVLSNGKIYALKVYKNRVNLSSRNEYNQGKWIREKSFMKMG